MIINVVHGDGAKLCLRTASRKKNLLFISQTIYEYGTQMNNTDWENRKNSEKVLSQCHLSTANPTWTDPGENPGPCGDRPATNLLSYCMAICFIFIFNFYVQLFLPVLKPVLFRLKEMNLWSV
jgi:hypothetical protein